MVAKAANEPDPFPRTEKFGEMTQKDKKPMKDDVIERK